MSYLLFTAEELISIIDLDAVTVNKNGVPDIDLKATIIAQLEAFSQSEENEEAIDNAKDIIYGLERDIKNAVWTNKAVRKIISSLNKQLDELDGMS